MPSIKLILGVGITLLGLLAGAITVVILGVVFVLIALATRTHEDHVLQRLERAKQVNREQASLEAVGLEQASLGADQPAH